jgi:hypothetical protein
VSVQPVPERFRPVIATVVARLADGDYEGIRRDGFVRDSDDKSDFAMYVREYPAALVPLPQEAWLPDLAFAQPLDDGSGWYFLVDLWTREEGRSDLTLEGTLHDAPDGPRLLIDNIHVM